jgi:hypothetical protein
VKALKSEPGLSPLSSSHFETESFQDHGMPKEEEEEEDHDDDETLDVIKAQDPSILESHELPLFATTSQTTAILDHFLKDSIPISLSESKGQKEHQNPNWIDHPDLKNDLADFILHDEQFLRDFHDFASNESELLAKLTEKLQNELLEKEDFFLHLKQLNDHLIKKTEQLDILRIRVQSLQDKHFPSKIT